MSVFNDSDQICALQCRNGHWHNVDYRTARQTATPRCSQCGVDLPVRFETRGLDKDIRDAKNAEREARRAKA